MQRVMIPEWLDVDAGNAPEIAASLRDLCRINRWFGGVGTSLGMLREVARRTGAVSLSLLEVAAGAGAVPEACRRILAHEGVRLDVTVLDRAASHLDHGTRAVAGDALALPFPDSSFDVVSSNLFVHHLSPAELAAFMDEALRVARRAVLINDLVRSRLHLALVYAGLPLFSRITRHDAPASVRQAFTPKEIKSLLATTRAAGIEIRRRYLYRMAIMIWK